MVTGYSAAVLLQRKDLHEPVCGGVRVKGIVQGGCEGIMSHLSPFLLHEPPRQRFRARYRQKDDAPRITRHHHGMLPSRGSPQDERCDFLCRRCPVRLNRLCFNETNPLPWHEKTRQGFSLLVELWLTVSVTHHRLHSLASKLMEIHDDLAHSSTP